MLGKRGNRKSQTISTDFIVALTLYFTAFSIFSYYIFAVEGRAFTQRSFLQDTYYNFDIFEENARNAGLDIGSDYHLNSNVIDLEDFSYEELKAIVLNGTQFEAEIGVFDVCVYLTDKTENVHFHAGPGSKNITLGGVDVYCGDYALPIISPFPECSEAYEEGFSATKLYFYNETKRTAQLVVHFCRR